METLVRAPFSLCQWSCLSSWVLAYLLGWQFGRTSSGSDEQAAREAVIAKVRPAVVEVNTLPARRSHWLGVIIDNRGDIRHQ